MTEALQKKWETLQTNLTQHGSVAVAFSGGVDSSFLLWACHHTLGKNTLALTVTGEMQTAQDKQSLKEIVTTYGIDHRTIPVDVFAIPEFCANGARRCYYCKKVLFTAMQTVAQQEHKVLLEGSNLDDLGDYRPGRQALTELGVASPLLEAGLTKGEIRQLSHHFGLPTWNHPSCACLASRVPYGTAITPQLLERIGKGEEALHALGFSQVRLRAHGDVARLEVAAEDFDKVLQQKEEINKAVQRCGFAYVALDLMPYQTGRLNVTLERKTE